VSIKTEMRIQPVKYFVTGATGFIGGRLTEQLINDGHEVIALVRTPAKAQHLEAMGVTLAEGDITEKDTMRDPMRGVDGVFHMAAWYKVGVQSDLAEKINVDGTRNVLELMRELDIPKGVYTSTVGVFSDTDGVMADESYYFDPAKEDFLSEYERTKWQAHYEVAQPMIEDGLPLVIVMPGLVYGPGDTSSAGETLRQFLQGDLPMMPQKTAFVWAHVDDIATAHRLAMQDGTPGETYIIAGEKATFIEAMHLAEELTGIPAPKLTVPPAGMKLMAGLMGLVNRVVDVPAQYHPESLRTIAGVTYLGDNSKARRELGYQPRSLREGLRETLAHDLRELGMTATAERVRT
jgi:nucleoside-diphosphate-sugar epimerase